jgi:sirohydrochlorin cobaltochelatase
MAARSRCGEVAMMATPGPLGLLLAAHGERRFGADNDGVIRLARELAMAGVAAEVGIGFIKGEPAIDAALAALTSPSVLVYPLFLADGYFSRVRMRELVGAAAPGRVRILPPLGLDPALAALVVDKALVAVAGAGRSAADTTLVLLAHGSPRYPASRRATELMESRIDQRRIFAAVRPAFLEEPPSLAEAVAAIAGPAVVVGLFVGEGLHGGADVPQLMSEIARPHVAFAGNLGGFADLAALVADAVRVASTGGDERVD